MFLENYLMYLRKSRADDPDESVEEVLKKHYEILQEYSLKKLGGTIPEKYIFREIVSGETIEERPEMQKVLSKMEDARIYGVLVVDCQRLSRGDLIDCGTIINSFKYSNTLIITPTKTFDLSYNQEGPNYDEKMLKMELNNGSEYLEYTKMIMKRGRNLSRSKGNYLGSIAPYGYKRITVDKNPTLAIDEVESKAVKLIFKKYLEGAGYAKIGNILEMHGFMPRNIEHWNNSVIKDILINPIYTGKICIDRRKEVRKLVNGRMKKIRPRQSNYTLIDGKHPAIISMEDFNKVQERIGTNPRVNDKSKMINPLSGLMFCKKCGRAIVYRVYKKDNIIKSNPRYLCANQKHCHTKSARVVDVYESIIETLNTLIENFEFQSKNINESVIDDYQSIIDNTKKELDNIEIRQNELYDLLESKIYSRDTFIERNNKLDIERKKLQKRLDELIENSPSKLNYEKRIYTFKEVVNALKNEKIEAEEKNILLRSIIKRIEYDYVNEKIEINLFFK